MLGWCFGGFFVGGIIGGMCWRLLESGVCGGDFRVIFGGVIGVIGMFGFVSYVILMFFVAVLSSAILATSHG